MKKEHTFYFTYRPMNRYGELFHHEVKVLGVSFKKKKEALNWLKENASVLVSSIYRQFKDQLEYINQFMLYLYKDNKVTRTLIIRHTKQ